MRRTSSTLCSLRAALLAPIFSLVMLGCTQSAPPPVAVAPGAGEKTSSATPEGKQPVAPAGVNGKAKSGDPESVPAPSSAEAKAILEKMVEAYRAAPSYVDEGTVRRVMKEGKDDEVDEPVAEFSLAFARPNKLRLQCYQGVMVSDGKQIAATINGLTDQVLVRPAPEKLTLKDIFPEDPAWLQVMTSQIAGTNPQIALLVGDKPLDGILEGAQPPVLEGTDAIDQQPCHRIKIKRPEGTLILWINQKTHALRRVQLPIDELLKQNPGEDFSGFKIIADFANGKLGAEIADDVFAVEIPEEAIQMRQFVAVEPPRAPPAALGKMVPEFTFTKLDGTAVTRESIKGKVVIFDFWATWCQPCLMSMPNLEQVFQKYKDNDQVLIVAVSIDQPGVTDKELTATMEKLGVHVPIARPKDLEGLGEFGIEGIPTLFVVDGEGKIQQIEIGYQPELAKSLPATIDQIRAGKSVVEPILEQHKKAVAEYRQSLQDASLESKSQTTNDGLALIAEPNQPERLKLSHYWSCDKLASPGNILVVPPAKPDGPDVPTLLVHDGWRTVAEVNLAGAVTARHELTLNEDEVVASLRTALAADGKRYYLASAPGQQRFHLFDENWKLLWHHPEGKHDGVGDARLADLDGDGSPEILAGYFGVVGVHAVSLKGERLWANRTLEFISSLAAIPGTKEKPGGIVCTNSRGTLAVLDPKGEKINEVTIGQSATQQLGRIMRLIAAADLNADGASEFSGLAITPSRAELAVGFDGTGRELWSYRMPPGLYRHPIEPIVSGRLEGAAADCWVLAGANGSIHFIAADGRLIDQFNYGDALNGLALVRAGNRTLLIVSSTTGEDGHKLEAWQVTGEISAPAVEEPKPPAEKTEKNEKKADETPEKKPEATPEKKAPEEPAKAAKSEPK